MAAGDRYGSRPEVTVNGSPLAAEVVPTLVRVEVHAHVHLPGMVVLHFLDAGRDVLSKAGITIGSTIAVSATSDGDGSLTPLLTGEVTALEQQSDTTGTWTVVRGYDPLHRLCRGRRTRTFANTTDADIVAQVASQAQVQLGEVVSDGPVYEHVSQANLTDWDFLRARAHETGHELAVTNGMLNWRSPGNSSDAPSGNSDLATPAQPYQLMLGGNMARFRPRVTAAEQVSEVQVRGWDPVAKQAVVGSASAATTSTSVGVAPADMAATFGAPPYVVVDRPVTSQDEADSLAGAIAEQIACAHAEAEGSAIGDPLLLPGAAVQVSCVGWPHDGSYVLTAARHCYDESGYRTDFTVSGRQERSLLGLASVGATKGSQRASGPQISGLVVGQVTDIADPDNMFRVKVSFPWLSDDYESWWARVAQPGAGSERGLAWLPEVGDEVLVAFGHGDVRAPYVIGGLYNGVDAPPMADQLIDTTAGQVVRRVSVSRTGHRLVMSDDDSAPQVLLATGDDNLKITLDASQTSITIDSSGSVTISGSSQVQITSDGDVSIQAQGSLSLSGQTGVSVSGQTGVTIDGGPSVSVSGDVIQLN
ncbi:MAG TPA: VgrG-related protein [Streptosporangiaceae bacterium]|nr:VgrG-related protein [Streptosporangiaceae bacterium]